MSKNFSEMASYRLKVENSFLDLVRSQFLSSLARSSYMAGYPEQKITGGRCYEL
jgi:hypothetical protein